MERRTFVRRYLKFISQYKKLEEEKKKCLKQYFDNQTVIQVHSANIIRSMNSVLNVDMLGHFKFSEELIINRPVQRQIWKINRRGSFWEVEVPMFTEEEFKQQFRMSRRSFEKLCTELSFLTREDTNKRKAIPLDKRIAIALNTLGRCHSYKTVSNLFGVGRTTVGELVTQFTTAVCEVMQDQYINAYPPTPEKIEEILGGFQQLGLPQCYGVLGVNHIEISPNRSDSADYLNSEGWHSVILLAAVDHSGKFTFTHVGSKGKTPSNDIFESSTLKAIHKSDELFAEHSKLLGGSKVPIFLVGSSAFGLTEHVMKPYPENDELSENARILNDVLFECQKISAAAFKYLKSRFAMIGLGLEVHENNCNTIIKACCILHNFLVEENDYVWDSWLTDLEEQVNRKANIQPEEIVEFNADAKEGIEIRESLTKIINEHCNS